MNARVARKTDQRETTRPALVPLMLAVVALCIAGVIYSGCGKLRVNVTMAEFNKISP